MAEWIPAWDFLDRDSVIGTARRGDPGSGAHGMHGKCGKHPSSCAGMHCVFSCHESRIQDNWRATIGSGYQRRIGNGCDDMTAGRSSTTSGERPLVWCGGCCFRLAFETVKEPGWRGANGRIYSLSRNRLRKHIWSSAKVHAIGCEQFLPRYPSTPKGQIVLARIGADAFKPFGLPAQAWTAIVPLVLWARRVRYLGLFSARHHGLESASEQ